MNLRTLIALLLLGASLPVLSQQRGFSVTGGISTFEAGELKQYQDMLLEAAPVDVKGFTYFPPHTNIRLRLFQRHREKWKFTAGYSYTSTGAHGNYTDQSGYMDINQYLTSYQLGAAAYYRLFYWNFIEAMGYANLAITYTDNEVNRVVSTNTYYYEENTLQMRAFHPVAEAGVELLYHLNNYSFGLEGGYQYDVGGTFKVRDNTRFNSDPVEPQSDLKSNISGFRLGVKFVLLFKSDIL